MISNEKLDREEILRARREAAIKRAARAEKTILAVQGTASLNYNAQPKVEGIGYISGKALGVNIHSSPAVAAGGLLLGLSAQPPHNRARPHGRARSRESKKAGPLEGKGSFRWVQTLGESAVEPPCGVHIVTACGREGDMAG
jgi:hypothetical protein